MTASPSRPPAAPAPTIVPPRRRLASAARRTMIAVLTERLALKCTALFLAIVVWFVVNAKEPQIELVPVRFTPVLDSFLVLRDPLPQVQAIVAGSPKQLIKLGTSLPTIRRQITADAPDTLVVDLRPEDVTLPEGVDAVVREVEPHSLTLRFESMWSRAVPVRPAIDVAPAPGTSTSAPVRMEPDSVEVSGPRRLVARISFVRTMRTTISLPDSLPHLIDLDTSGLTPAVRLRPTQVKVSVAPSAAPR